MKEDSAYFNYDQEFSVGDWFECKNPYVGDCIGYSFFTKGSIYMVESLDDSRGRVYAKNDIGKSEWIGTHRVIHANPRIRRLIIT